LLRWGRLVLRLIPIAVFKMLFFRCLYRVFSGGRCAGVQPSAPSVKPVHQSPPASAVARRRFTQPCTGRADDVPKTAPVLRRRPASGPPRVRFGWGPPFIHSRIHALAALPRRPPGAPSSPRARQPPAHAGQAPSLEGSFALPSPHPSRGQRGFSRG